MKNKKIKGRITRRHGICAAAPSGVYITFETYYGDTELWLPEDSLPDEVLEEGSTHEFELVLKTDREMEVENFLEWREEVDSEKVLDSYDLALAWFSAKGFSHDEAVDIASDYLRFGTLKE